MTYGEILNSYIDKLNCKAKDICEKCDISNSSLSRYRCGERVPNVESDIFNRICTAICLIANEKGIDTISSEIVKKDFLSAENIDLVDKKVLRKNLNTLIEELNINTAVLCKYTNYDASSIFRFRSFQRSPANPDRFASDVAACVALEHNTKDEIKKISEIIKADISEISDKTNRAEKIKKWLVNNIDTSDKENYVSDFLSKLDSFDLNEYIKLIHFNEMTVPKAPFLFPTSKTYYGLKEMMQSELDFLKATVLSKSKQAVTMYSDVPMTEMAKDPQFPKKWMLGMALMLKKGLQLNSIHNIDRSFDEIMLGLISWIPLYLTGQITPYYIKAPQNSVFHHFLRVSGCAVLSGEAIVDHHCEGRYYLSKTKEDIAYYNKKAKQLLNHAKPLMDIYRENKKDELYSFINSSKHIQCNKRSIRSSLPIYTMKKSFLEEFLNKRNISNEKKLEIISYYELQKSIVTQSLKDFVYEDEFSEISQEEFVNNPIHLSLSGIFFDCDLYYTYDEYLLHLNQTKAFSETHKNYLLTLNSSSPFKNLQITIGFGEWVLISKENSPAIHFIVHHPKLISAIEKFSPPLIEDDIIK